MSRDAKMSPDLAIVRARPSRVTPLCIQFVSHLHQSCGTAGGKKTCTCDEMTNLCMRSCITTIKTGLAKTGLAGVLAMAMEPRPHGFKYTSSKVPLYI